MELEQICTQNVLLELVCLVIFVMALLRALVPVVESRQALDTNGAPRKRGTRIREFGNALANPRLALALIIPNFDRALHTLIAHLVCARLRD